MSPESQLQTAEPSVIADWEAAARFTGDVVDIAAHDLPAVKAAFVVERVPDGCTVLDVGCGGGKMLRTLGKHHRGLTLLGCDIKTPPDIDGDFTFAALDRATPALPYHDSSVDVVLLIDVLEHVEQPEATLAEIARILRPGGRLLAFVPIEGEPLSWYSVFRAMFGKDLYARTKGHINSFRRDDVERLLADRFVIDERHYSYHFFGQLMDAALWASALVPPVRRALWTHSPYHGDSVSLRTPTLVGRVFASCFRAANAAAWGESRLLRTVRCASAGFHVAAHLSREHKPVDRSRSGRVSTPRSALLLRWLRPAPAARYIHRRAELAGSDDAEHDFGLDVASESSPNYLRWVAEAIDPYLGREVLEIGAGLGSITQHYVKDRTMVLTDLSGVCVASLRERFAGDANVTVVQEDARSFSASQYQFDSIVMINVLEHVPDDLGLLMHLRTLLKPHGRIVLYVPALNALYGRWDRKVGHCRRYSKWRLAAVAEEAGLVPIELRYMNILAIPAWLALSRSDVARTQRASLSTWDRTGVPLSRALERRLQPPIGLNLLAVLGDAGEPSS